MLKIHLLINLNSLLSCCSFSGNCVWMYAYCVDVLCSWCVYVCACVWTLTVLLSAELFTRTVILGFLGPIVHYTLQSLTWLLYWNGRGSHKLWRCMACENLLFQTVLVHLIAVYNQARNPDVTAYTVICAQVSTWTNVLGSAVDVNGGFSCNHPQKLLSQWYLTTSCYFVVSGFFFYLCQRIHDMLYIPLSTLVV